MLHYQFIDNIEQSPKLGWQINALDELLKHLKNSVIYDLKWKCGNADHMIRLLYILQFSENHEELYMGVKCENIANKYYSSDTLKKLNNYLEVFSDIHERNCSNALSI